MFYYKRGSKDDWKICEWTWKFLLWQKITLKELLNKSVCFFFMVVFFTFLYIWPWTKDSSGTCPVAIRPNSNTALGRKTIAADRTRHISIYICLYIYMFISPTHIQGLIDLRWKKYTLNYGTHTPRPKKKLTGCRCRYCRCGFISSNAVCASLTFRSSHKLSLWCTILQTQTHPKIEYFFFQ